MCVWARVTERVMNYDGSNGILPLMGGTGPIRSIVNRENVSRDVEGLERVYDIISVLPQQRYGAESLGSPLRPRGLKSQANTGKNLQRGGACLWGLHSFLEGKVALEIARQRGAPFKLNHECAHWKPNRKPDKCAVGETLDIGILNWYLVCGRCCPPHPVSAWTTFGANSS